MGTLFSPSSFPDGGKEPQDLKRRPPRPSDSSTRHNLFKSPRAEPEVTFGDVQTLESCKQAMISWSYTSGDDSDDGNLDLYVVGNQRSDSTASSSTTTSPSTSSAWLASSSINNSSIIGQLRWIGQVSPSNGSYMWDSVDVPSGEYLFAGAMRNSRPSSKSFSNRFRVFNGTDTSCFRGGFSRGRFGGNSTDTNYSDTSATKSSSPSASSSPSHNTGAIIASCLAGVVALFAVVGFAVFLVFRRRRLALVRKGWDFNVSGDDNVGASVDANVSYKTGQTMVIASTTCEPSIVIPEKAKLYSPAVQKSPGFHSTAQVLCTPVATSTSTKRNSMASMLFGPVRRNSKFKSDILPPRPESVYSIAPSVTAPSLISSFPPPPIPSMPAIAASMKSPARSIPRPLPHPSRKSSLQSETDPATPLTAISNPPLTAVTILLDPRDAQQQSLSRSQTASTITSSFLPSVYRKSGTLATPLFTAAKSESFFGAYGEERGSGTAEGGASPISGNISGSGSGSFSSRYRASQSTTRSGSLLAPSPARSNSTRISPLPQPPSAAPSQQYSASIPSFMSMEFSVDQNTFTAPSPAPRLPTANGSQPLSPTVSILQFPVSPLRTSYNTARNEGSADGTE